MGMCGAESHPGLLYEITHVQSRNIVKTKTI